MRKTLFGILISLLTVAAWCGDTVIEHYRDAASLARAAVAAQDYATALDQYRRLLAIAPYDPDISHEIARLHALRGETAPALARLEKALELGFDPGPRLDPAFDALREQPGFAAIRRRLADIRQPVNSSRIAFTISTPNMIPEGIAWDPVADRFYVGSIWQCKILKVDRQGRFTDFTTQKQDGLRHVLGMKVDAERRHLWVASEVGRIARQGIDPADVGWSGLLKYDLTTGRLIKKHTLQENGVIHLFNDIALTARGDVFVTDSEYGAVYTVPAATDTLELFIPPGELIYPNGITRGASDDVLYVSSSGNTVYRVDVKSRRYRPLDQPDDISLYGIDGMVFHGNSLVCVQNGLNRISRFFLNPAGDAVTRLQVIETRHPRFDIPTTGVMAGDTFHYIANAQLRRLLADGTLAPAPGGDEIVILAADMGPASE